MQGKKERSLMRAKRGTSAIVTTVLIILITVTTATILWTTVIPITRDNLDFSELDGKVSVLLSEGYTVYDEEMEVATVQIEREIGEGVMNKVKIIFSFSGNSIGHLVDAPESGQTKVYAFDLSEHGEPEGVSVAPVFTIGNREEEGDVGSMVKISSGDIDGVEDAVKLGEYSLEN